MENHHFLQWSVIRSTLQILDSIVASIPACHAGDPGSIPGRGVLIFVLKHHLLLAFCTGTLPLEAIPLGRDRYRFFFQKSSDTKRHWPLKARVLCAPTSLDDMSTAHS